LDGKVDYKMALDVKLDLEQPKGSHLSLQKQCAG